MAQFHSEASNKPLSRIIEIAEHYLALGAEVYQRWTCEKCGERVTSDNANTFTLQGHHTEKADGSKCGYITDIQTGCGLALVWRSEAKEKTE